MSRLAVILARHAGRDGALLPILHDVQHELGCVDAASEAAIAAALNLSRAEVHGVVSFYHDFTLTADARPVVQICRAEACQARGIEALIAGAEAAAAAVPLGACVSDIEFGTRTPADADITNSAVGNSRVRLTAVYCLGLCSVGPAARVGDTLHARLDAARLAALIAAA